MRGEIEMLDTMLFLNEDNVSKETVQKGVMVALYPSPEVASRLAVKGGIPEKEIHLTVAYLGKTDDVPDQKGITEAVKACASSCRSLKGTVGGIGKFNGGEKDVLYVPADVPGLFEMRGDLMSRLKEIGVECSKLHDFTPHVTLTYFGKGEKMPLDGVDTTEVSFSKLHLVYGGEVMGFDFGKQ
jgi:2'-5' RNA ligase